MQLFLRAVTISSTYVEGSTLCKSEKRAGSTRSLYSGRITSVDSVSTIRRREARVIASLVERLKLDFPLNDILYVSVLLRLLLNNCVETLSGRSRQALLTLLKVVIYLDMMGVRKGDQYHLMQPIYLYWNI